MARTWMILARVVRVVQAEAKTQVEHAAVGEAEQAAQALAEQAAVEEAEDAAQAEQAAVGEAENAAQALAEQAAVEEAAQAEQAAVGEAEQAAQALAEQAAVEEAEDAAQDEQAAVGEAQNAAQALAEQAAVEEAAQAEQAEVAAARAQLEEGVVSVDEVPVAANNMGEPGITISVAPPPRVTFVTARLSSLPVDLRTDMYPYIIASGPFCLLAHFARAPYSGTDLRRVLTWRANCHHLIVVRHFRRAGGQIAATAVRVPARPRAVSRLRNIESVGLFCDGYTGTRRQRTYNFRIAELMVDTGRNPSLELVIFRSDRSYWFSIPALKSPLVNWDCFRRWVPHGAVAVDSTIMWFDLSWGILSCDVEQEEPEDFEVFFYRLPRNRGLRRGGATEDIHTKRCIAVSGGLLRYVEIIIPDPNPNGEAATVSMWSLRMGDNGWRWIANYSVRFEEIWNNDSYVQTGLQQEIPVLAGVCPANPDVVYFDLHHRLFGVNVLEGRVVDYEANQHELVNVPEAPLPQTGSGRYLLTWNLLRPGRATAIIGHVSPDLPEDGFPDDPRDDETEDPKGKGKSKATYGRRKSTSVSSSRPSKSICIK